MVTNNKEIENYLDWLNEMYGEDLLNTMRKEKKEERENLFQVKNKKIDNIKEYDKKD